MLIFLRMILLKLLFIAILSDIVLTESCQPLILEGEFLNGKCVYSLSDPTYDVNIKIAVNSDAETTIDTCEPPCAHGKCIISEAAANSINSCECEEGWFGDICDSSADDSSSPQPVDCIPEEIPSSCEQDKPLSYDDSFGVSSSSSIWKPKPLDTFQIILSGKNDFSANATVYEVDLFSTTAQEVAKLKSLGRHPIAYSSFGSVEKDRPDTAEWPKTLQVKKMSGWDEQWLDVSQIDTEPKFKQILENRIKLAKQKGFESMDPDNMDAYANSVSKRSGGKLTASDQLKFNRWVAQTIHKYGMSVALKNDLEQAQDLVNDFDFAVNEECTQYSECASLQPFTSANKAIFNIEYKKSSKACTNAKKYKMTTLFKTLNLNAKPYITC